MFQDNSTMDFFEWNKIFSPALFIIILIFLILLMLFITFKSFDYDYLVILTLFLFSLIFGTSALEVENLPFNPYFPIFFILIQTLLFFINSLMYIETQRGRNK